MTYRKFTLGEKPETGKFYLCQDMAITMFQNTQAHLNGEESPEVVIPKRTPFLFVETILEAKEPGQLKDSWFTVVFDGKVGVVCNHRFPFHFFMSEVVDDTNSP